MSILESVKYMVRLNIYVQILLSHDDLNQTFLFKKFFKRLFNFERQRQAECKWEKGRESKRHRMLSRLLALTCQHRA